MAPFNSRLPFLKTFALQSKEETQKIAKSLSLLLVTGDMVLLSGSLGAGKTTFARFIISALSPKEVCVQSPTFPLLLEYETCKGPLIHADLYRLEEKEVPSLNLLERCQNTLSLIEWPERSTHWPACALGLELLRQSHNPLDDRRLLRFYGQRSWQERLAPSVFKAFQESCTPFLPDPSLEKDPSSC
ncbi:MAG: tRNA (adenosine(37)-N6)-threonylcarbamoyltransferase complex ATPase subunit type 1 TsaE [Holosporaceae bacterium]